MCKCNSLLLFSFRYLNTSLLYKKKIYIKENLKTEFRTLQLLCLSHSPTPKPFMFTLFVMEIRYDYWPQQTFLTLHVERRNLSECLIGIERWLMTDRWGYRTETEGYFWLLLLTWRWWRCEGAWCQGWGTGGSSSRRCAAWPYQRRQYRHPPQSERTGWDWTPPEERNQGDTEMCFCQTDIKLLIKCMTS